MINEVAGPRDILKRVRAIDDSLTGGSAGGFLRGIYHYLFGLKRKIPGARIAKELDAVAAVIRDQNIAVYPRTLWKLAHIAAWCGGEHRPENTDICIAALNVIETTMEWPIRDLRPGPVIAKLESIIGTYENMNNVEVVQRIKHALRVIEQRRVLIKPNTRKI